MNTEIEQFKNELTKQDHTLRKIGYSAFSEQIYNPKSLEHIFYETKYINEKVRKVITFNFYPSTVQLCKNQIDAYITFNSMSIGISSFLAYKKLERKLSYNDIEEYKFHFDPLNLAVSIRVTLSKIIEVISVEMLSISGTEDKWLNIPIHDLRDDY